MQNDYINQHAFLTILLMAVVTYLTRISGYAFFRNYHCPRLEKILEVVPGCVLISLIAPSFMTGRIADMIALGITVLTAIRCSFLVTLIVAIGSTAVLRGVLG